MNIEILKKLPENCNGFDHDLIRVGQRINKNWLIMWAENDNEIIVINEKTGNQLKLSEVQQ